ncbi:hypothetical protein ASG81_08575 [Paenibacillus sp. Soil522]|nr:hypothetical protein ASG81_08575 [Paenibacillus sp. Soil522]
MDQLGLRASLQDIASRFFISREYVSRRFKQEFGMNISEYMEKVRIDNAKILLSNEKYLIATIAEMAATRMAGISAKFSAS